MNHTLPSWCLFAFFSLWASNLGNWAIWREMRSMGRDEGVDCEHVDGLSTCGVVKCVGQKMNFLRESTGIEPMEIKITEAEVRWRIMNVPKASGNLRWSWFSDYRLRVVTVRAWKRV
ncbi:hypothetical protein FB45DRAFT_859302 [Roridomyces roridus]|uniref:Secreted protein n=1 Tax=Roridomyces roridus TaxID=1738132 RepID=A0AAD7CJG9_9AGAR|nr:hypothetical protein FB45DRAFT_859302 [Roridomyces roridus]